MVKPGFEPNLRKVNPLALRLARLIRALPISAALPALVLAAATGLGPARAGEPEATVWTIVEASGEARYRLGKDDARAWRRAEPGTRLAGAARLETGAGGRLVVARGGNTITMSPGSRILLPQPEETGGVTQVFQALGVSLYKIMKRAPQLLIGGAGADGFEVHTPYLMSTVKGTTFVVSVTALGAGVDLIEGVLRVSTADESFSTQITGGQLARVTAGAPRTIEVMGADGTGRRSIGREARADAPRDPRWDAQPAHGPSQTGGVESDGGTTSVTVVIGRSGGALGREPGARPVPRRASVTKELARLNRDLAGLGNGRGVLLNKNPEDAAIEDGCAGRRGGAEGCAHQPDRGPEMSSLVRGVGGGGSLIGHSGPTDSLSNHGTGGQATAVGSANGGPASTIGSATGSLGKTVGSAPGGVTNSVNEPVDGLLRGKGLTGRLGLGGGS